MTTGQVESPLRAMLRKAYAKPDAAPAIRIDSTQPMLVNAPIVPNQYAMPRGDITAKPLPPPFEHIPHNDLARQIYQEEIDSQDDIYFDSYSSDDVAEAMEITDIMEGVNIIPDPSQLAAATGLCKVRAGCLIGAAGTGKTTTTRLFLNMLLNGYPAFDIPAMRISRVDLKRYMAKEDESEVGHGEKDESSEGAIPAIALVAFTGQATQVLRKNMPGTWKRNVMTIHSLLGYAPEEYTTPEGKNTIRFVPSYTADFKMPWDAIIIDEASMVDLILWHQMFSAAKEGCRFYFIGDLNQLTPPIGQGILGFALAELPTFELSVVHRQSGDESHKIVDAAWNVLQGKMPVLEDPKTQANWRVIGFKLSTKVPEAHAQILSIAKALSEKPMIPGDPNSGVLYDPWRDRIMTPMNGYDENKTESYVGQHQLNESLANVFRKDAERIVISYQRGYARFAVGYRVMATKNEGHYVADRVTNGLTGRITDIKANPNWLGDWSTVGLEEDVQRNRAAAIEKALGGNKDDEGPEEFEMLTMEQIQAAAMNAQSREERQSGPASHVVTVAFDNGAIREYDLNAEIEQLKLAYASTTHKAQGAEMPTAIIVLHEAMRKMLTRENFYTALTRAKERVIILYTDFAMQLALAKQEITGNNLQEKIRSYAQISGKGEGSIAGFRMLDVRLPDPKLDSDD